MFKGNGQKIWVNGKLLGTLSKAEAKIALNFEEMELCGTYGTEYEYTGWKGDGTLTFKKVDSSILNLLKDGIKSGKMPNITIVGANLNDASGKSERVSLMRVNISEVKILNAEAKKLTDEELPFTFSDFEPLELA